MDDDTLILALDQGTTSARAVLFDYQGTVISVAQIELRQIYPQPGWVEHDPEEIWRAVQDVISDVLERAGVTADAVTALGITNQRETTLLWERAGGQPIHNAIVWQDRRTAELCTEVVGAGHSETIQAKTGLVVDAYFSASKIRWLLNHVEGAREAAERGDLLFGTIDSFLLWRLTGGNVHATDATNAARTMLFNIHTQEWDDELLKIWGVPRAMLPVVRDSNAHFGDVQPELFGAAIPITGIAGDQHAAMVGQACFEPGMMKSTYGTGAFLLLNTGITPVTSTNRLLTTLAYRINGQPTYALEGSIFSAGSAIQWLRDGLGTIPDAGSSESLAASLDGNDGVYLVPAFTGLGAPYWDPDARAAVFGITRDTSRSHFARAALEAVAYQTRDLLIAMQADGSTRPVELRVDGGMVLNEWLCQFLADIVQCPVQRPANIETTVLGAALLAGLGAGVYPDFEAVADLWTADLRYEPNIDERERDRLYAGWQDAIARTRSGS
ncbi:glycerol kinase GlpK [soil metagenome]